MASFFGNRNTGGGGGGGGLDATVIDNLLSNSSTDALSARMGGVLKTLIDGKKVETSIEEMVVQTTANQKDFPITIPYEPNSDAVMLFVNTTKRPSADYTIIQDGSGYKVVLGSSVVVNNGTMVNIVIVSSEIV